MAATSSISPFHGAVPTKPYVPIPVQLTALAERIRAKAEQLILSSAVSNEDELPKDSISLEPIRFAYKTNCQPMNHLFEGEFIQGWLKQSNTCPLCRGNIKGVVPDETSQQQILELRQRGMQPAERKVVETLKLAQWQLNSGQVKDAFNNLEQCATALDIGIERILIHVSLDQSRETIAEAMKVADLRTIPDEKIVIYKQIIAYAPKTLEAYVALLPLLTNFEERRDCCLQAADLAEQVGDVVHIELAKTLRNEAETPPMPTSLSPENWANPAALLERMRPHMPQALKDFLQGKNEADYIIAPRFKCLSDGTELNVVALDELDRATGGPGCRHISEYVKPLKAPEKELEWLVMTKRPLEGIINGQMESSRGKSYARQAAMAQAQGCEMPSVQDAAYLALWEYRLSGQSSFGNNPWTYTRCCDVIQGQYHPVVGGFVPRVVGGSAPAGLLVYDFYDCAVGYIGVVGLWKF